MGRNEGDASLLQSPVYLCQPELVNIHGSGHHLSQGGCGEDVVFERDYKAIQRGPSASYLSYKVQSEFDCSEERIRRFSATFFSGRMGSGDVVHVQSNEGKWP